MTGHVTRIVLASGSPRRRQLLTGVTPAFDVRVSDVDESTRDGESPAALVERLSLSKAMAVRDSMHDETADVILASDTIVVAPGGRDILGKPRDAAEATAMLERLRGRQHTVFTGIALVELVAQQRTLVQAVPTPVDMRAYSDKEIAAYVATGDPMDKAGSYAIQHPGFTPVERFEGCYANVMGLPLCHVYAALMAWGYTLPRHPLEGCPYPQGHEGRCPWADRSWNVAFDRCFF